MSCLLASRTVLILTNRLQTIFNEAQMPMWMLSLIIDYTDGDSEAADAKGKNGRLYIFSSENMCTVSAEALQRCSICEL